MPVKITSKGIFKLEWNSKSKIYKIGSMIKPDVIFTALREEVLNLDGVTLKTIFKAVDKYPKLKEFISQYCWCKSIDSYHKEAYKKGKQIAKNITICKVGNVAYISLSNVINVDYKQNVESTLLVLNLKNVSNTPMKLITHGEVYQINKNGEEVARVEGKVDFSLLDILEAIYWEISFFGGIEDTKTFFKCAI